MAAAPLHGVPERAFIIEGHEHVEDVPLVWAVDSLDLGVQQGNDVWMESLPHEIAFKLRQTKLLGIRAHNLEAK